MIRIEWIRRVALAAALWAAAGCAGRPVPGDPGDAGGPADARRLDGGRLDRGRDSAAPRPDLAAPPDLVVPPDRLQQSPVAEVGWSSVTQVITKMFAYSYFSSYLGGKLKWANSAAIRDPSKSCIKQLTKAQQGALVAAAGKVAWSAVAPKYGNPPICFGMGMWDTRTTFWVTRKDGTTREIKTRHCPAGDHVGVPTGLPADLTGFLKAKRAVELHHCP